MFSASTHKSEWIFRDLEELNNKRLKARQSFIHQYLEYIEDNEEEIFLTLEDEQIMLTIVQEAAFKFGDEFKPRIFPSTRYMAFAYYKRFYLCNSIMEYSAKPVMMACYFLAMKIDEFYISIQDFVANLKTGNAEENTRKILALEPEILRAMNYSLMVHAPYRTLEGLLIEIKQRMVLNFNIEALRPVINSFLDELLLGDAMLLFSPVHIALASMKYALASQSRSPQVLHEFMVKLAGISDPQFGPNDNVTKLISSVDSMLDEIIQLVQQQRISVTNQRRSECMSRAGISDQFLQMLKERQRIKNPPLPRRQNDFNDSEEEMV